MRDGACHRLVGRTVHLSVQHLLDLDELMPRIGFHMVIRICGPRVRGSVNRIEKPHSDVTGGLLLKWLRAGEVREAHLHLG